MHFVVICFPKSVVCFAVSVCIIINCASVFASVFLPGEYIYIETSAPQHPGQKAVLTSQVIPINTGIPDFCFTFWYHMSGATIGTLNVTYNFVGRDPQPGFSRSGDQGNQWIQGFLPVGTPYDNFVVRA